MHELNNDEYAKLKHRRAGRLDDRLGTADWRYNEYDRVLSGTDCIRDTVYEIHDLLEIRQDAARQQITQGLDALVDEMLFSDPGILRIFSPKFVNKSPEDALWQCCTGPNSPYDDTVVEHEKQIASLQEMQQTIEGLRGNLTPETDSTSAPDQDLQAETPSLGSALSGLSVSSPKI